MTDDLLPPIAVAPGAPPEPTKRGRGRPAKLNPDGTRANPPRKPRGDRAPRRTAERASTPRPRAASLKTRIGAQLAMLSMAMTVIPPIRADALSPVEIDLLADGIDKQCQQSPRFKKYVERALAVSGAGGLVGAIAIIGARRVSRHEAFGVPAFVDPMLGELIGDKGGSIAGPYDDAVEEQAPPPEVNGTAATINERAQAVEARIFDYEHNDFATVG